MGFSRSFPSPPPHNSFSHSLSLSPLRLPLSLSFQPFRLHVLIHSCACPSLPLLTFHLVSRPLTTTPHLGNGKILRLMRPPIADGTPGKRSCPALHPCQEKLQKHAAIFCCKEGGSLYGFPGCNFLMLLAFDARREEGCCSYFLFLRAAPYLL